MINFIQDLKWRGMLQDIKPGTEDHFDKAVATNKPVIAYIGFDPTATSLHLGSLMPVMLLRHLQAAGHKPVVLIGGATGMIGDPSFKPNERQLLDAATLDKNVDGITNQLRTFLDFEGPVAAEVVNNYDWFKQFSLLDFLRDVGKHLTINYMMAKDSVKKRLETGISFTEFSYQLLQGYDFYHLHKNYGVTLQMGGSDQWGNITSGTELIRRMDGGEAFALTAPLLTKADGTKFGKSEGGNIWLAKDLTSPYKFYQYLLNVSDVDAPVLYKYFSNTGQTATEAIIEESFTQPHLRLVQKDLAFQLTNLVHGEVATLNAIDASGVLFGKGTSEDLATLDKDTFLDVFEGVEKATVSAEKLYEDAITLISTTTNNLIAPSKGEARKLIAAGGILINGIKANLDQPISTYGIMHDKYLLIKKGKKSYYLITVR